MRPNTYDVLIVEINCYSQNVQLQSACSNKFLRLEKDRVIANENSEYPQNFTIESHELHTGGDDQNFRITFYIKELESYVCFNKRWQPRLLKKLSENCYFKEVMDGGYFLFYSSENPEKYLGFNRNGKPINYLNSPKIDKQCRKIFKRITEDSNELSTSTIDYGQTSSTNYHYHHHNNNQHHQRHKLSTRIHQRTHINRIETSKPQVAPQHPSSKRNKLQTHPVRHHHNEHHRLNHTTSNKNIDSYDNLSSTKQLVNEDLNAFYSHNDSGVNIKSERKEKQITTTTYMRHHQKILTQSVSKLSKTEQKIDIHQGLGLHSLNKLNSTKDNVEKKENNNVTNNINETNCTYITKNPTDENDDKNLRGKKIIKKGRKNAQANEKPNKCNSNNRRQRKNNGNGTRSRKTSQKSSSHTMSPTETFYDH